MGGGDVLELDEGMFQWGLKAAAFGLPFLPTHIREAIEKDYSGQEAGRAESLLTFWGRAGTEPIDDGILKAFSHQPIPSELFAVREVDDSSGKQGEKLGDGRICARRIGYKEALKLYGNT